MQASFLLLYKTPLQSAGGYLSDLWEDAFFITNILMITEKP